MSVVTTEHRDRTAVLTIDHPPVNAGNAEQRRALAETLSGLGDVDGVVITGAGRHFYAGSDLREFDGELASPELPDVIALVEGLIEKSGVPVVAAISGLALGGGLELALACTARVGDTTARLGFPEVGFGILPGAGGTVRAPRLIGVPAAIDLVATGRQVDAAEALTLGLLDAVVPGPGDLLDAALALIADPPVGTPFPASQRDAVDAALAALPKRARPNARRAAEQVARAAEVDAATALAEERALFHELRVTPEAENLRYLFFAKGEAAKDLRGAEPAAPVRTVGVVGAGTMGAALARTFAAHGHDVTVVDTNETALARLTDVTTATDLGALAGADLVIDAVFEDLQVKRDLLTALEPVLRPDAVIASNTSYLDLDELALVLQNPDRFGGLHFFNPPDRNRLVEVIRAAKTSERTAATLGSVVRRLGKTGIPAGVGDGFVANRVYADYRTQAEFLVEDGASPEQVDAAVTALGLAIGPFAVADMSGLDIAWARRKRLAPTRDPRQRYVEIADRLCEAGRLGRKTGGGWYAYPEGARRGVPDPQVTELVAAARAAKGITPRELPAAEIQDRILGSMVAAAAVVVAGGVARRASDVDVALTEGFAFPVWLGGPLRLLSRRPDEEVVATLAAVHASDPISFPILAPAARGELPPEVAAVLRAVAPKGRS